MRGIQPQTLSNKELISLSETLINDGGLPEPFQRELLVRLAAAMLSGAIPDVDYKTDAPWMGDLLDGDAH